LEKHFIEVPRTARYYLRGNTKNPKSIWLALHGYGQQAKFFLPKLNSINGQENLVVVAEAINRFYLSGYNGRVGATWMTSDDREADITDNHRYLDLLVQQVLSDYNLKDVTLNVFAFSQGIATACRWMASTQFQIEKSILWAGSIPPDLDWNKHASSFQKQQITYVYGNQDEFFDDQKVQRNLKLLSEANIACQLVTFDGKHEVHSETLKAILNA
jgi:predicted esterase